MSSMNYLIILAVAALVSAASLAQAGAPPSGVGRVRRSEHPHHAAMHNHMSRKVFDRACAASKDTIDEIMACVHSNEGLMKAVKTDAAKLCYKEAFGAEFDHKDVIKHKELICNNRDKFESMTSCLYKKTAENMNAKELEKLTETLVDVGLCIINALDS